MQQEIITINNNTANKTINNSTPISVPVTPSENLFKEADINKGNILLDCKS